MITFISVIIFIIATISVFCWLFLFSCMIWPLKYRKLLLLFETILVFLVHFVWSPAISVFCLTDIYTAILFHSFISSLFQPSILFQPFSWLDDLSHSLPTLHCHLSFVVHIVLLNSLWHIKYIWLLYSSMMH